MRTMSRSILAAALLAAVPLMANAESQFTTGAGTPITASAKLDFQITIPKILFLQVGTGTNLGNNAAVDQIAFDLTGTPAAVGNGTAIAATALSGDVGNGTVTAKVLGNNGTITLSSAVPNQLNNGSGDTISFGQIAVATTNALLTPPALVDNTTTNVSLIPATGKVFNQTAQWTYTYKNQNVVAPGTYGGVNVRNSRVTYTASMP